MTIGLALLLAIESLTDLAKLHSVLQRAVADVGKLKLLSDSDLDWGQDLNALGKWYESHKDRPLYLCYFGYGRSGFYKIEYTNLTAGWLIAPQTPLSDLKKDGYVAISATNLQGVYVPGDVYKEFRDRTPIKVINETIYIYDYQAK